MRAGASGRSDCEAKHVRPSVGQLQNRCNNSTAVMVEVAMDQCRLTRIERAYGTEVQ